jgi:hypothetical protein
VEPERFDDEPRVAVYDCGSPEGSPCGECIVCLSATLEEVERERDAAEEQARRIKFIEIRDRMTFIAAMAVRLAPASEAERYLASRSGFGIDPAEQAGYVMLTKLCDPRSEWDPFAWSDRTMTTAHAYVQERWDELESGAVVDVEFIRGETKAPKRSECEVSDGE